MEREFYKYHALGNDYIVIDPNKTQFVLAEDNIRLLCHRNFGIGSDGILYGPVLKDNSIQLRIFNPDGSEAEKSGNGIRMFARYLVDAGYVAEKRFRIATLGGEVAVELLDKRGSQIRVDMGNVTFRSGEIPVAGADREVVNEELTLQKQKLKVTCVSVGNPHCIVPCAEISREMALLLGPQIENHPSFPNRINVQFLKVLDRSRIQIEIWERGAGYTLASGSSSCAAASAAHKLGLVDNQVSVTMPGGTIQIELQPTGHVLMTGAVTQVAKGMICDDLWEQLTN